MNDQDFDKLTDEYIVYLNNLRTFNNYVLNYYLIDLMEIDKIPADFFNISAWKFQIYNSFARTTHRHFENIDINRQNIRILETDVKKVRNFMRNLFSLEAEFKDRHQCQEFNDIGVFSTNGINHKQFYKCFSRFYYFL